MDNLDLIKEAGPTVVSIIVLSGVILKISLDNNRMTKEKGSAMISHMREINEANQKAMQETVATFTNIVSTHLNNAQIIQTKLIDSVDRLASINERLERTVDKQVTIQEVNQRGKNHRKDDIL